MVTTHLNSVFQDFGRFFQFKLNLRYLDAFFLKDLLVSLKSPFKILPFIAIMIVYSSFYRILTAIMPRCVLPNSEVCQNY